MNTHRVAFAILVTTGVVGCRKPAESTVATLAPSTTRTAAVSRPVKHANTLKTQADAQLSARIARETKAAREFEEKLAAHRREAFARGEAVGQSKAAITYFEKGRQLGEETGRLKGASDTEERLRREMETEVQRAREAGTRLGELVGEQRGKAAAERHSLVEQSTLGICFFTLLVCSGFFVLARRLKPPVPVVYSLTGNTTGLAPLAVEQNFMPLQEESLKLGAGK